MLAALEISIHVPAWGTTEKAMKVLDMIQISIHVPAWGTTATASKIVGLSKFQSTFPRGERPSDGVLFLTDGVFQSTFPRGERRSKIRKILLIFLNFNPRSRVGNDSKFSQIFFAFLCNKYNFSTFYYPFSLFFGVIRFTFLIFVVRILPIFYVYF